MAKKEGNVKLKFRVDNSKGFDNVKIVRKRFKATKVPDGITSKKTSTGINVTIAENGRKIATLRGYNNNQNVQKGLHALSRILAKARAFPEDKFMVTDLTPKKAKKK